MAGISVIHADIRCYSSWIWTHYYVKHEAGRFLRVVRLLRCPASCWKSADRIKYSKPLYISCI